MEPVGDSPLTEDVVRTDDDKGPIGDVVLGSVDPRMLSRQNFDESPDILLHGSHNPFTFDPNFDYENPDYAEQDFGTSTTLGTGFYATDSSDALDYAEMRAEYASLSRPAEPYVARMLPYQARCLDVRLASDPTRNAQVPIELANQWRAFFERSRTQPGRFDGLEPRWKNHLVGMEERYFQWLQGDRTNDDIQGLLAGNMRSPGPPWMSTFREFMLSLGYDGLIANQGSEKDPNRSSTTYVFYNLHKIGTYDSWQDTMED